MHQHAYSKSEQVLGEALIKEAEQTMHDAREEEKAKVLENDQNKTFIHSIWGLLVLITVAVDMGWNKRSLGWRYDSPSGVTYMIGVLFQKILMSTILIRIFSICDSVRQTKSKLELLITNQKHPVDSCCIPGCVDCCMFIEKNWNWNYSSKKIRIITVRGTAGRKKRESQPKEWSHLEHVNWLLWHPSMV